MTASVDTVDWAERYPWATRVIRTPDESLLDPVEDRRAMRFMAPRALWANGPWDDEPDLILWRHEESGYPLLMWRNHMGCWCGYVGVPEGHVLFGLCYDSADFTAKLSSHQGLTFSGVMGKAEKSVAIGDSLRNYWWLGFDCGHFGDLMRAEMREASREAWGDQWRESYKDVAYVRGRVEALAEDVLYAATVAARADRAIAAMTVEVTETTPPSEAEEGSTHAKRRDEGALQPKG